MLNMRVLLTLQVMRTVTYMDADGYMVTADVEEDGPEGDEEGGGGEAAHAAASTDDAPAAVDAPADAPAAAPAASHHPKPSSDSSKSSTAKGKTPAFGAGPGKQTSMLGFFGRK